MKIPGLLILDLSLFVKKVVQLEETARFFSCSFSSMFDLYVEMSESSKESGVDLTIESAPLEPRKLAASSATKGN